MATEERGSVKRPSKSKKVSIVCEAETKIFIQRYRQYMREHLKVWNVIQREFEKAVRTHDMQAAQRLSDKLDRSCVDWDDIQEMLKELLASAKVMDRMRSR